MSRAGGFPPVFLTGLPIIQVNVLRTYAPTQIMFPLCKRNLFVTTNLVISGELLPSYECAICVDTLHHLCRVCSERPLLKGIFYSWNILFCRIHLFWRLIIFRIMFRIKTGIYTNNAPCLNEWAVSKPSRCLKITNIIRNRGVLSAVAERDADDADRTAVKAFSALTPAADVDFGAVFSVGTSYLFAVIQLLDWPRVLLINKRRVVRTIAVNVAVGADILPHFFARRRGFHALHNLIFLRSDDGR